MLHHRISMHVATLAGHRLEDIALAIAHHDFAAAAVIVVAALAHHATGAH